MGRCWQLFVGIENGFINLRRPGGHAEPMAGRRREGELMQFSTKSKKHRMFINNVGMAITDKQGTPRVIMGSIDKLNPVIRTGKKSTFQQWSQSVGR